MSKTCKDCLHCSIEGEDEAYCSGMPWHYPFGGSDTVTLGKEACDYFLERDKPTLFHRITQSPEMLAPKLVYPATDVYGDYYISTIIDDEFFNTKAEAIAATVAKLKEVEE